MGAGGARFRVGDLGAMDQGVERGVKMVVIEIGEVRDRPPGLRNCETGAGRRETYRIVTLAPIQTSLPIVTGWPMLCLWRRSSSRTGSADWVFAI